MVNKRDTNVYKLSKKRIYWSLLFFALALLGYWYIGFYLKRNPHPIQPGNYVWLDHAGDSLRKQVVLLGSNPRQTEAPNVLMVTRDAGAHWQLLPVSSKEEAVFTQMDGRFKDDTLQVFLFNGTHGLRIDYVWRDAFLLGYMVPRYEKVERKSVQEPIVQANFLSLDLGFPQDDTTKRKLLPEYKLPNGTGPKKLPQKPRQKLSPIKKEGIEPTNSLPQEKNPFGAPGELQKDAPKSIAPREIVPKIDSGFFSQLPNRNPNPVVKETGKQIPQPKTKPVKPRQKTQNPPISTARLEPAVKPVPPNSQEPVVSDTLPGPATVVFDAAFVFGTDSVFVVTQDGRAGWMTYTPNDKEIFEGLDRLPLLGKKQQRVTATDPHHSILTMGISLPDLKPGEENPTYPYRKTVKLRFRSLLPDLFEGSRPTQNSDSSLLGLSDYPERLERPIFYRSPSATYVSLDGYHLFRADASGYGATDIWSNKRITHIFQVGNTEMLAFYDDQGKSGLHTVGELKKSPLSGFGPNLNLIRFREYLPHLSPPADYRWIGAALALFSVLISLGLWADFRIPLTKKTTTQAETIANPLVLKGDRPASTDSLKLYSAELETLSQIMVDRRNEGPITFVADAPWGRGKSSFMLTLKNRLDTGEGLPIPPSAGSRVSDANKERLQKKLSKSVITHWLNIWHYEAENDLLAAFLTSIHHAVFRSIPWWKGLWWKMLWIQTVRSPFYRLIPVVLLITIGIPFLLFFFLKAFLEINFGFVQEMGGVIQNWSFYQTLHKKVEALNVKVLFTSSEKDVASLLGLSGTLVGGLISAISILPKNLRGSFKSIFKSDALQAVEAERSSNQREIFKQEFWNLMEQLGDDRILVIFIDDVDRIDGGKIKEMLQTINFMTDIGSRPGEPLNVWGLAKKMPHPNLYFVLGMWVDKVAKNLGRELITEKELNGKDPEQEAYKEGKNYIDKIADLIITIPEFDKADLGSQITKDWESNTSENASAGNNENPQQNQTNIGNQNQA